MGYEEEKKSVSSQEQEKQNCECICGKKYMNW